MARILSMVELEAARLYHAAKTLIALPSIYSEESVELCLMQLKDSARQADENVVAVIELFMKVIRQAKEL